MISLILLLRASSGVGFMDRIRGPAFSSLEGNEAGSMAVTNLPADNASGGTLLLRIHVLALSFRR